jgi:broad specificity phosphatase PhoE
MRVGNDYKPYVRMCTIVLVRHGQTTGQSNRRYFGATDIPLSDFGRRQMMATADALAQVEFDAALTSPLRRARESAAIVLEGRPLPARVVEGFREVNFGRWEGWTVEEIAARDPIGYRVWQTAGLEFRFPGGDSRLGFRERIEETAAALAGEPFRCALWVLHKGVIRVTLTALTGMPRTEASALRIELGSIHRLERSGCGWQLAENNTVDHLGDAYEPDR